jgi:hypothetical protein
MTPVPSAIMMRKSRISSSGLISIPCFNSAPFRSIRRIDKPFKLSLSAFRLMNALPGRSPVN